jgi:hypothetical protein
MENGVSCGWLFGEDWGQVVCELQLTDSRPHTAAVESSLSCITCLWSSPIRPSMRHSTPRTLTLHPHFCLDTAELAEPIDVAELADLAEPEESVEPAELCPSGVWYITPLPWGSPQPRHRLFGAGFSSDITVTALPQNVVIPVRPGLRTSVPHPGINWRPSLKTISGPN